MKQMGLGVLLLLGGMLVMAACGGTASGAEGLPTLAPTLTAVPLNTPTSIPASASISLPEVNWDDLEPFRAAMRPEFAGDIDAFAHRNRYVINASLAFEGSVAIIQGAERVRYTNRSADILTEIVFRLYPNLSALGGRMTVYRAELNGVLVTPVLAERETALIIPLDTPLQPGDSAEIGLTFSTAAERGIYASYGEFGFHKDIFSAPEWYPALSVYEEGRGWWMVRPTPYGDVAYMESGLYDITLTTPRDFIVVMSGTELDPVPAGDDTMLHRVVSGPMRDSLLVASPLFGTLTGYTEDGVAVNVYYWPGGEAAAETALEFGLEAIATFSDAFGPYPFAEFDIVETFNWTGVEYPGMTVISDRFWERSDPTLEEVIVHETGHQWFYSMVGNNQVEHPWLDEALTSYSEYVYWRAVYGEERYKEVVRDDRDAYSFYQASGAPDMALNLPVTAYMPGNNYGLIIYVKGPLFFLELESLLGRETFQAALRRYVTLNRYGIATSADLLAAFEEVSGDDLDPIFFAWVGAFDGLDPAVLEAAESGR